VVVKGFVKERGFCRRGVLSQGGFVGGGFVVGGFCRGGFLSVSRTNLSSTGNPTVKTVKAISRYVIKPLTYLFHCLTSARIFICLYIRCSVVWYVRADHSIRSTSSTRAVIDCSVTSVMRYSRMLVDNHYPLVFRAPVRGEAVRFTQQPLVTKN